MVTVAHGTTQNASRPTHSFGYQGDRALLICSLLDHTVYRPATFSPPSQMIVPLYDVKMCGVRPEFTGNSDVCLILAARFRVASGPNPRQPFWSAHKGIHVLQSAGMRNRPVCQRARDSFEIIARSMKYEKGQGDPPFLISAMEGPLEFSAQ